MLPYGQSKRTHKIHPHNECGVCAQNGPSPARVRQESKKLERAAKGYTFVEIHYGDIYGDADNEAMERFEDKEFRTEMLLDD